MAEHLTNPADPVYVGIYFGLIIFFTYFYVSVTFNPEERADEMKKFGGFIPASGSASRTADYLSYVLNRSPFPARFTSASSRCCLTCSCRPATAGPYRTCHSAAPRF